MSFKWSRIISIIKLQSTHHNSFVWMTQNAWNSNTLFWNRRNARVESWPLSKPSCISPYLKILDNFGSGVWKIRVKLTHRNIDGSPAHSQTFTFPFHNFSHIANRVAENFGGISCLIHVASVFEYLTAREDYYWDFTQGNSWLLRRNYPWFQKPWRGRDQWRPMKILFIWSVVRCVLPWSLNK